MPSAGCILHQDVNLLLSKFHSAARAPQTAVRSKLEDNVCESEKSLRTIEHPVVPTGSTLRIIVATQRNAELRAETTQVGGPFRCHPLSSQRSPERKVIHPTPRLPSAGYTRAPQCGGKRFGCTSANPRSPRPHRRGDLRQHNSNLGRAKRT